MNNNKQSPSNVSNAFMDKVQLSERQSIRIAIEQMAINNDNESIKTGYDAMVARQEKSLTVIKEHQEKMREKNVQSVKRQLLNEPMTNNKPVFRPKFMWHGVKQSELERAAEGDALSIVLQDEERRIATIEKKLTEDRQRYLSDAIKSEQLHTQKFNQSSGEQRSQDRSQDRGGYER